MIRAKGGKRQPRYYYLQDAGAERIAELMDSKSPPPPETAPLDDLVAKLREAEIAVKNLMDDLMVDMFLGVV